MTAALVVAVAPAILIGLYRHFKKKVFPPTAPRPDDEENAFRSGWTWPWPFSRRKRPTDGGTESESLWDDHQGNAPGVDPGDDPWTRN